LPVDTGVAPQRMTQQLACRQSDPETKGPGHEGPLSSGRRPPSGPGEVTFQISRTGHAGLHGCQRRGSLDLPAIGRQTIGDHRPAVPWPGMGPGRTGPDARLSVQSVRRTVRSGGRGGAFDAIRVSQALTNARGGTLIPPQSTAAVSCRIVPCTGPSSCGATRFTQGRPIDPVTRRPRKRGVAEGGHP
jgi:hypothetical protein